MTRIFATSGLLCLSLCMNAQVGIGTTSPSEILDLESSNATKTALDINNTGGGDPKINFQLSSATTFSMGIDNSDSDKFKIGTSAVETSTMLTIDNGGKIGINDASPDYLLDVKSGSINVYPLTNSTDFYRYKDVHALSLPNTNNVYVGEGAGAQFNSGGTDNVFVGYNAGNTNTTGDYNVCVGSGSGNSINVNASVLLGYQAGNSLSSGFNNTLVGYQSGYSMSNVGNNTYLGYQSGYNLTGASGICIGYMAGPTSGTATSNLLYVDNSANDSPLIWGDFGNNRLVINGSSSDNTSNRTFFSNGNAGGTAAWFNDSDVRLKKDITTISSPLQKVLALRGVNYNWIDTINHAKGLQMGFIAQEAQKIIPEVVDTTGKYYSMQYAPVTALLVEAVKEQQQIIEEQKLLLQNLQKEIIEMKKNQPMFTSEVKVK